MSSEASAGGEGGARAGPPQPAASYLAMNVIVRILRMVCRHRLGMGLGILAAVAAANFQLLIPRYLGAAVDHAQALLANAGTGADAAKAALWTTALVLFAAGLLRGVFTMVQNYLGEALGHRIGYELRLAYFEKLQRLSFGFHDRVHSGDLMARGMLDIEGVRRFVENAMYRSVVLVILVGYGGYHLLQTDPVLGALALSFVPIVAWRAAVSRLWLRRTWRELQERLSEMTRIMEENLGGIRVVRAFMAQAFELAKFDAVSASAIAISLKRVDVRYRNGAAMIFSYYAAMGLVLWVGGAKVIDGTISVGALTEFLAFMAILQQPVRQIGMIVNSTARGSISGKRVFEVIDLQPAIVDRADAGDLVPTEGVLKFEHVDFSYDPSGCPLALQDVSFEVGPGRTLGIVGPPGSGKSTLAHLVPRFYDVTAGRITIDGQDIRDVTLESLRTAVGVMAQDTFLFSAPIESNIAYGEPEAAEERVTEVAELAQLHHYIERLPSRYETLIGERGLNLSGGQRQRLSIARSILPGPSVIVFDDSTSSVDAGTEQKIRAALRELSRERTTIIISHRLSSLIHADEILFLDGGRVVERGTHAELLALRGRYQALYELQMHGAAEGAETTPPPRGGVASRPA
ncbi:MAG: ABC transporter ATP-binding protein [Betaproteobacteria bacterium]|nr:MAG: ABC transporter ATP-binding protein [Betaproteobacteria bacterium]